jgi:putative membrane protein
VIRVCMMAGLGTVALLAQAAVAQQQSPTRPLPAEAGSAQELPEQDQTFAKDAAEGGLKEVQFGKLAEQHARSPQVADFGRRMVQDHGKANEQLKQIAQGRGAKLPQELPPNIEQEYQELQKLAAESEPEGGQETGPAQFDQIYMQAMVKDHEEDIRKFEKEAEAGQDSDLRGFAEETLPILREHLELAEAIQAKVAGEQ